MTSADDFKELREFVDLMNSSNSTNHKINILTQYQYHPFIKRVLFYTYHPYWNFGLTSTNLKKRSDLIAPSEIYDDLFYLLDDLNERHLTGHAAIEATNRFIKEYEEWADLIYQIIDRNLETRATVTLINRVNPNFIPTFDVALAHDASKVKGVDIFDGTWFVSRKLDGCLHGDSLIEFEDGTTMTIENIVKDKIPGKIKSLNTKNGKIEYKEILDWMINLEDISSNNNEWFEIILENGKSIKLTGNHRVWLPKLKCWRRVDELTGDEFLLIK
jgi:hypothetical protein